MITFKDKGNFEKLTKFFKKSIKITGKPKYTNVMERCIENLKAATPIDSGLTAEAWSYTATHDKNKTTIEVSNTNIQNGISVVFLLEHGHATGTGGWVAGKHFVGPEIRRTYEEILNTTWKEIQRL